tara:strand:+ start:5086 stop:5301 length:216 start_codon:yes stop_codon:yes gene_type:complete
MKKVGNILGMAIFSLILFSCNVDGNEADDALFENVQATDDDEVGEPQPSSGEVATDDDEVGEPQPSSGEVD